MGLRWRRLWGATHCKASLGRRSRRRRDGVDGDMEPYAGHTETAKAYQRTDQKGIVALPDALVTISRHMADIFIAASSQHAGMHCIEM